MSGYYLTLDLDKVYRDSTPTVIKCFQEKHVLLDTYVRTGFPNEAFSFQFYVRMYVLFCNIGNKTRLRPMLTVAHKRLLIHIRIRNF